LLIIVPMQIVRARKERKSSKRSSPTADFSTAWRAFFHFSLADAQST
jgi:hypothetical protein